MVWDFTGIIPWYGIMVGYPMIPVADKISMEHGARRMEHGKHGAWEHGVRQAWSMAHGSIAHGSMEHGSMASMEHGKHRA